MQRKNKILILKLDVSAFYLANEQSRQFLSYNISDRFSYDGTWGEELHLGSHLFICWNCISGSVPVPRTLSPPVRRFLGAELLYESLYL